MKKIILSLAAALCLSATVSAQPVAPFKDGDRVVFLGNSITDGGHYHSYIWLYYMTRFPEMNLRILNAGIGGETAGDMYKRLDGDVFSKRPTVLSVTFGMNDTGYMEYNGDDAKAFGEKRYKECYDNYKKMEKRLQTLSGVRVVMLGGSPYDETAQIENTSLRGKNAVMDRVVAFQKESAATNGWEFMDFSAPFTALAQHEQATTPSFSLCVGDRIHPDNDGHMVMAYLWLKAQGFAGGKVADVAIDAPASKVLTADNCAVTNVRRNGRTVEFDYLANALPYPLDTVAHGLGAKRSQADATRLVPFMEEMNSEMLTVKGLKGNYELFIDGQQIGVWSAKELASGINLAAQVYTPQYQQALAVMYLNEYRWEIERNFRDFAWVQYDFMQAKGLLDANNHDAVKTLDAEKEKNIWLKIHRENYAKLMLPAVREARQQEIERLTEQIYRINKPQTRHFELRQK